MDGPEGTDRSQDDALSARLYENATGIAATLVTAVWLTGLLTGQSWWLPALVVGYAAVVPVVATVFGDDLTHDEWTGDRSRETDSNHETDTAWSETGRGSAGGEAGVRTDTGARDALETLRERYAAGDLTEDQFERKLEQLLEMETLEDVDEWVRERDRTRERDRDRDRSRDRDPDAARDRDLEYDR